MLVNHVFVQSLRAGSFTIHNDQLMQNAEFCFYVQKLVKSTKFDVAQLLIFIRALSEKFEITDELVCMCSMLDKEIQQ